MYNIFEDIVSFKDRTAFKFFNDEQLIEVTYDEYYKDICNTLLSIEKKAGSINSKHIGIFLNNSYEYAVILMAIIVGHGIAVPINLYESQSNIDAIIDDADLDILITKKEFNKESSAFKKLTIDEICRHKSEGQSLISPKNAEDDADRITMIIYTSGTTGLPKGVMLSYRNLFYMKKNELPKEYYLDQAKNDELRTYLVIPMYHVAGISCLLSWCSRGCTIFINKNIGEMLMELKEIEVDFSLVSPAIMKLFIKKIKRGKVSDLGGLKEIASVGAPVTEDEIMPFLENGISFGQLYGLSEIGGEATYNYDNERLTSVGKAINGREIVIKDSEICIKGECNSNGYYKNEKETSDLISDGLLHTGDLGYIDDNGYVYITGRKKNLIILSGGENVAPEELERVLYHNKNVIECRAYGADDRIHMTVVANKEHWDEIREYIDEMNKSLSVFKRIYKPEFQTEPLEKTSSGKIKR